MPPPNKDPGGLHISWQEILASWDLIVSDLYAIYGSAVDTITSWLDLRRLILGLLARKESAFTRQQLEANEPNNP